MNEYRLSDLLDLKSMQKMADAHYRAAGMPIGIIDAFDGAILVGTGWQDICVKFHRAQPVSLQRCRESDNYIRDRLVQGAACAYKCLNGLWDIGMPIVVAGRHLATMFVGQFFYEGEVPDRESFARQAHELGFDEEDYLAALDRVPVFTREKVDYIVEYDKALVSFIADLSEHALSKIKADEIIQNSERQFHAVFDQAYQFIGLLSLDGSVLKANRTALGFSGIKEADVLGRPFWETPWWTHSPQLQQKIRQSVLQAASGELVAFEATHPASDGQLHYFDFSLKPVRDEAGKVVLLMPEGREVTGRKQAEEAIKQQAEFLQELIDAMPYPVFYKDCRGRYMSCNRAFEDFYGLQRGQIAGKTVYEIAPKDLADTYARADKDLFENPGVQQYEGNVQSPAKGRRTVIFHKATFQGPDGTPAGIVGTVVDITERKKMEEALEGSEAKMRSILDNIGIGVVLISPEMEILEINRRIRKWFPGIDVAQCPVCYRVFNDPPLDRMCDYCPACKTLRDGRVHEAIFRKTLAGAIRNYRIISSPLFNSAGEISAVIEMVDDITEKLTLESQLRQAQKMEAVGRLAGGVAHDFNNMLGVILGYAELASAKVDPAQPLHTDLTEINRAAKRSTEIVRQLLAFARKQPIAPKIIDLNETVESTLKMLRRLIGEDIDLIWRSDSSLEPVIMDPTQVEQILANLCVNARDAIADIGKITIETANDAFDETYCVNHAGYMSGSYAMLSVADNGMGMDPETLDNIFEPFFSTKEVGRGTGLGLATVYGIVKQNNGFINVSSRKGEGTTFKVYLPQHAGLPIAEPDETAMAIQASQGETVLVVEDETPVLKLACRMLDSLGYTVLAAASSTDAIRLARKHNGHLHLLITDVILPKMNGRALADHIREIRPDIKCLFMSGYTADVIANRGILDQGVDFIPKPFSKQEIAAKVRKVLKNNG